MTAPARPVEAPAEAIRAAVLDYLDERRPLSLGAVVFGVRGALYGAGKLERDTFPDGGWGLVVAGALGDLERAGEVVRCETDGWRAWRKTAPHERPPRGGSGGGSASGSGVVPGWFR